MKEFTKSSVMEVSDKIQTLLDELSKKEGIKLTMAGGNYKSDSFTLKIKGVLLTDEGTEYVSETSNSIADNAAKRDDIAFTAPHFIGSVWRFSKTGLVRVEEYSSKNKKYPYICSVYGEDRRVKAAAISFKMGTEVLYPTAPAFYTWFTTDVEADTITKEQERLYDKVNDYISVTFEKQEELLDAFFEACGEYFDNYIVPKGDKLKKHIELISNRLYGLLILDNNLNEALNLIKTQLY